MPAETFKSLLNAASFPLAARLAHQAVLIPGLDQNVKTPREFYGEVSSADYGVPQLIYAENVMPTSDGLIATSFQQLITAPEGAGATFDQFIQLRDVDENLAYFCPAGGANFVYRNATEGWESVNPIGVNLKAKVSRAYVNGRTFICYAGLGIYEYDTVGHTIDKLTLTGITDEEVLGISQSNNYLLAHTNIGVYWSSLIDPTDFTPSLETGAGNNIPQDVKGPITALIGVPGGFLIFTPRNCIAATYSTNIRQPFIFREVDNCGGIDSYEQVTTETSSSKVYAWTTGGLQTVNLRAAESIYPEVSDFLTGKFWEEWNTTTKTFVRARQVFDFVVKVAHVSARYLVISYGRRNEMFAYALILDLALKRWGKVKLDHTDVTFFTYLPTGNELTYASSAPNPYTAYADTSYADAARRDTLEAPLKESLAFLKADGSIHQLVMDYRARTSEAVAIFGRYQLRRAKFSSLQTVRLDHIEPEWEVSMTALPTVDGASEWLAIAGVEIEAHNNTRMFGFDATGKNVAFAVEGTFELKDVEVTMSGAGR